MSEQDPEDARYEDAKAEHDEEMEQREVIALREEVERERKQTAMWLKERAVEKARADALAVEVERLTRAWTDEAAKAVRLEAEMRHVEAERDENIERAETAERVINDAWGMIGYGWDDNIESRAEWEKRYAENFQKGGSSPLGMAIHAAGFKRDTKAEAEAARLREALREIAKSTPRYIVALKRIARAALASTAEEKP